MKAPKITVYIACHNHEAYIEEAIESVLRQAHGDWELLIYDDNSADGSSGLINLYSGDPRIRCFTTAGVGLPSIANMAIETARGEYIVRLDGDDYLDENMLLVLANYLDRHPDMALVFPDYYLVDEFGNISSREWREKLFHSNHVLDMPPHGACTMIRRTVLQAVGGYREDLGAQDGFDLWVKVKSQYRAGNVNIPLFYYRRHEGNLTGNVHRIANARRRIKNDAVADRLDAFRPITAVIPCRQNYDFVRDLWKQDVNGRSLLQRALDHCTSASLFDRIVVACDNPQAEEVVAAYKDKRVEFVLREAADTIRSHSIVPTLDRIVKPTENLNGITVLHYVQAPFLSVATLEEAIATLILEDADTSFGVEEIRELAYKRTSHGLQAINRVGGLGSDFSTIYREVPSLVALSNKNLRFGSMFGPRLVSFVATPEESYFINSQEKLDIATVLAKRFDGAGRPSARPVMRREIP